jgi:hypothetical protein
VAAIDIIALLFTNVNLAFHSGGGSNLQLGLSDKVKALDDEANQDGTAMFGNPTYSYAINQDGSRLSVVGYFSNVTGGSGYNYQTNSSISANIKAQHPEYSNAQVQAAVTATISTQNTSNATSYGAINVFNVDIERRTCPGVGSICFEESAMDATLRVIHSLRNNN